MPVILEEDFDNTVRFIRELADGITVIIPHLEMFNGGFHSIAESDLWAQENMGADTALASPDEVREYLRCYGHRRLMFGSDFASVTRIRNCRKSAACTWIQMLRSRCWAAISSVCRPSTIGIVYPRMALSSDFSVGLQPRILKETHDRRREF